MSNSKLNTKAIPKKLKEFDQWVAWKRGELGTNGKHSKIPINPKTGHNASVTDPETWGSFNEALERYETDNLAGIGFVLTEDDPFFGVDIDNCRDKETGKIEKWGIKIIEPLESYTEVSPSGTGIRIIAEGKLPIGGKRKGNIEIYDNKRFLTITGNVLEESSKKIKKRPQALKKFHAKIFGKPSNDVKIDHTSPCLLSDEEIIEKAKNANNGYLFKKLWIGDRINYSSHSEADLALCSFLAFWTGNDFNKIDNIFRQSGLMREKWERQDYREQTIRKAITQCKQCYTPDPIAHAKFILKKTLNSIKNEPQNRLSTIINDDNVVSSLALISKERLSEYEAYLCGLKKTGVTVRDIDSIKKVVKSKLKENQQIHASSENENFNPISLKSIFPKAPVANNLIIPPGWSLSPNGIFKEGNKKYYDLDKAFVAHSPVFIQGHLKNIIDGTENIRLTWFSRKQWKYATVNRLDIADSKCIVKLADLGCPVTSVNASKMVEYLAAFEAVNSKYLPQATVTHQMGWQGEEMDAFLLGKSLILPNGEFKKNMDIDKMSPEEWPERMIFFKGHDKGENQIAKGFHQKGKFKKWIKIEKIINKYPLLTFSIYASLASVLLEILDAPIIIVDWAFRTSRGKTTALKIAGSCWGNANMKEAESVVKTWNASRVWIERSQGVLKNLPLILDDTKMAKYPQMVSQLIYDSSAGQGRGRGSIQGMRSSESWRTIVLSSGESKAVNFTAADGGSHARVISLWGAPLGKKSKEKAILIRQLNNIIHNNYGHAGYKFVRYLLKNKDKWGDYRELYNKLVSKYQKEPGLDEVALRGCEYYAVIHLAAKLAKKALGLKIDYKKHLKKVFRKALAETSEADRAKEALREVESWIVSNKDSFWKAGGKSDKQPHNGWLGVWNPNVVNTSINKKKSGRKTDSDTWQEDDGNNNLETIAIMPNQLHKFLKGEGYEAKAIIRTWKDKGWLDTAGETKGYLKKVTIDGERTRCYVINEEAIKKCQD